MIRTIVFSTILLIASGLIQSTWLGAIAVLGVIPDVSLVILVWLSYKNGIVEGPIAGFAAGFAEDCLSASPIGFHAFVKTFVAAIAGLLHGSFFIDRIFLPVALGAVATLLKALGAGILYLLFGAKIQTYGLFDRVLWIEAAYNGLIAPFVFLLLGTLKKILVKESKRE